MLNICYIKNDANGHKTEDDEDLIAERMEGESFMSLVCQTFRFESLLEKLQADMLAKSDKLRVTGD
jgi:hypothetical protein